MTVAADSDSNSTERLNRQQAPADSSALVTGDVGATASSTLSVGSPSAETSDIETDPDTSNSALVLALKIAGSIVAPTTLLTALLFYFGLLHAYWFCQYFGVNYTV